MGEDRAYLDRVLALLGERGWEATLAALDDDDRLGPEAAPIAPAARALLAGWSAAERGRYGEALDLLDAAGTGPALAGWAAAGRAFIAMREKDLARADRLLDEAEAAGGDGPLRGTIRHLRATVLHHRGESARARAALLEHLRDSGLAHFAAGRALDTLGMIYAAGDDLHAARAVFRAAIDLKARRGDAAGLALSHGQLGRLCLDWGLLDDADVHLGRARSLAEAARDGRGQAQAGDDLGRVALARAVRHAAAGESGAARRSLDAAAGWLDPAIAAAQAGGWTIVEGYARKDRALVHLHATEWDAAEAQIRAAWAIFTSARFEEGTAHAGRALGVLHRARGEWGESISALAAAEAYFARGGIRAEVARTRFEATRTLVASGAGRAEVIRALRDALDAAEESRRDRLVEAIERELRGVDPLAYRDHVYRRARGRSVAEETSSLVSGRREDATALFLDLEGSTDFARGRDPEEVMMTLNQMMAELASTLRRHGAQVASFRGDGFFALVRGDDHAGRAVASALEMFAAIGRFNEPRSLLGLPEMRARIGIESGEVFLGNVGTYDKLDFTAIGTTVNRGARLEAQAIVGLPCIGPGTFERVGPRFSFRAGSPRTLDLKGLGEHPAWDVVGPASA